MPDSQSREPGFESPLQRFEAWAFSFASRRPSTLNCVVPGFVCGKGSNTEGTSVTCQERLSSNYLLVEITALI